MSEHVFDRTAWAEMDVFNQMGNIGSEVGRALSARRKGKDRWMMSAFYRGMDLMNATIDSWVEQGKPIRELLIVREQFAKSILTDEVDETLEKYFMEFAVAARTRQFA